MTVPESSIQYRPILLKWVMEGKMKTNLGGKLSLSVELGDHPVDVKVTKC